MMETYLLHTLLKQISNQKFGRECHFKRQSGYTKTAMTKVINDPDGTGKIAKIDGMTLAGKTGTAELKVSKEKEKN